MFVKLDDGKEHPLKQIILFIFVTFYTLASIAQAPEPMRYNFAHYTEETGLVSYQVNSTVQDNDGYIWIATNEGLQRFDGIRYKNFRPKVTDSTSIPSKSILQILVDKNESFWLLTVDGKVGVFDTKTFTFHQAKVKPQNATLLESLSLLKKLIADEFGNVFLLLPGNELLTYNKIRNEFSAEHNFFIQKPEWEIMDFAQQPGTKKYWMCIPGVGFAVYNHDSGRLSYTGNNIELENIIEHYKGDTHPFKIYFDRKGRIWHGGADDGLPFIYCYNAKKNEAVISKYGFTQQVPRYHEIHQFLEQQDGSIWISGINVLAKYLETEKQFQQVYNGYVDDRSIDFIVIANLSEDREHNIWVSTGNNGLFRFNPSEEFFRIIEHPSELRGNIGSGAPVTFAQDIDGSILVGVWNDGLYRYDKNLNPLPLGIKGFPVSEITSVIGMCPSGKGKFIWMAVKDGIYKYDQEKRQVHYYHLAELKSRIREIEEDKKGNLWIGLQEHGVYKWDAIKGKKEFLKGISGFTDIPSTRINKIMVDRKGYVWVGTFGEGAYVIDPETNKIIKEFNTNAPEESMLPERTVSTVLDYNDSLVIISTRSNVLLYNRLRQKVSVLGTGETTSGATSSMEKDSAGYVWLSTTSGLYRINVQKRVFIKFNRDDGITNDYFVISASYILPDGRMLFGATGTIVAFDPSTIKLDTSYPTVHVTDFKVMNRSLPIDSLLKQPVIELAPNENSIAMDLSTLSYNTSYAIRYKLEGLDNEWKIADRTHQLMYPYLPSGSYTLLVHSINAEGAVGNNPLTLYITVDSPFWKTWWFYGLLTLLIGSILFRLDRARMQRKETVHRMRSTIATSLHEEVNTALNNINILSEMAKIKTRNDPQKSTEFIEQIHSKSHNMIIAMDDMLWTISPDNDSMEKTVERMKEYIDALNNRHSAGIEILVDDKVKSLKLDMQFRHEAFLLFKESIQGLLNACATRCQIHLTIERSNLLYTMQFNNECCDIEQLHHLQHRQDMVKRLYTIRAKLKVQVHGNNSILELKIPIRQ